MARRPIDRKMQQALQRQTSVKSNEGFPDERFPRLPNLRVPAYLGSPQSDSSKNSDRGGKLGSPFPDDAYSVQLDSLRTRDQLSPSSNVRYLMGFDHSFSGNSSVPAVNRVSHQPSFESYDSSMSANSWASSNEPEAIGGSSQNFRDPKAYASSPYLHTTSQTQRMAPRSLMSNQVDTSGESANQTSREAFDQGGIQIRINLDEARRQQKAGIKSGDKTTAKLTDIAAKTYQSAPHGNSKSQNDMLKIIGSEKETVSDVKFQVGGGAPNIKGLWKRAFHSLRKDKSKREPSVPKRREPQSSSDEIDPVYHLLRCAASKSQSTAIATSGIGTPKPMDRSKPSTMESPISIRRSGFGAESSTKFGSYTSVGVPNKKSSSVTFRSPFHGNLVTTTDTDQQRDVKTSLEDPINPIISFHSAARALPSNLHPETSIKDAPLLREIGEGILEGCAEDEKSREAQLAYEQHKRLNARRTMLKNTQKSLSFVVDEDSIDSDGKGKRIQVAKQQRLRPPLSEHMKSLSVDDKQDIDDQRNWEHGAAQRAHRSPQFQIDPPAPDVNKPTYDELIDGASFEAVGPKTRNRMALLSTKSFSLDVPGSEKSDESDRIISGSSSPGHPVRRTGQESRGRERFRGSSRNSLSPLSLSKRESIHPPQYRTTEWNMNIQSQPNLDEPKQRYLHQDAPSNPHLSQSVSSKFPVRGSSSMSIYHAGSSYGRREHSHAGNIYFVINDFVPRRRDDLPLRTGQVVRVIENSDKLWWYGSSDGQVGYFPSTFVHRMKPS